MLFSFSRATYQHSRVSLLAAAATVSLLSASTAAHAQGMSMSQPNYNYFSGGVAEYSNGERGILLQGQMELRDRFFAIGKYEQVTRNRSNDVRTSQSIIETGVGRYFPVLDGTAADVSATVGRVALSQNVFSSGTSFYTLNTGISHREGALEMRGGYRYVDFSGRNSEHGIVASVYYYLAPQMSVGVEFNDVYGRSSWNFGARFIF